MTAETASLAIRKAATVAVPVDQAFALFTTRIGSWWPTETHAIHQENATEVVFEQREGGRVYERAADGREEHWARVLAWEPPHRVVLEWKVNPNAIAPTDVEVRFTEVEGGTRVELEHRGWERLGADAREGYESYDGGWDVVLGKYAEAGGT